MPVVIETGNQEIDRLFDGSTYVLVLAATGDLEKTPLTGRYALNRRYLDSLLEQVLHTYEGQCAIIVGVRPMRATAQAVHSSFGKPDEMLLIMDRNAIAEAQSRLRALEG